MVPRSRRRVRWQRRRPQHGSGSQRHYEALVVTAFEIGYGQKHRLQCNALPLGVALQKGVLIAPGACTHHSDMHQRYVGLASEPGAPNEVVITTPPSDKHAPRGIYMLFLLTNHGSVSHAVWVVLQ
ncbi:MAG: DUF1929 domain-containing protein [Planctomycetes bacterium]|nr:DUF1929 domain-containing protein [Planctomycetota bacterium]